MERFLKRTRVFRALLALLMLCDISTLSALADESRVKVTKTEFVGETVYLFYDLTGPPEQLYSVTLIVKKRSNPSYQYVPKYLTGDLGSSMFSGTGWRIAWNFTREFPGGVDQNDIYFIVDAKASGEVASSRGISSTVLWVAGGAVVVGGVVALLLLNKSEQAPPPVQGQFPVPPGRP
jgi:hypothetical protein